MTDDWKARAEAAEAAHKRAFEENRQLASRNAALEAELERVARPREQSPPHPIEELLRRLWHWIGYGRTPR